MNTNPKAFQKSFMVKQAQHHGLNYYLIESDSGLLTMMSEKYGQYLLVWLYEAMAQEFCAGRRERTEKVVTLRPFELLDVLVGVRNQGHRVVVQDRRGDVGNIVPIENIIGLCREFIEEAKCILAEGDEFARRVKVSIDRGSSDGMQTDDPMIDCSACGYSFPISQADYFYWRLVGKALTTCVRCGASFDDGVWDVLTCGSCGTSTGLMPLSVCEDYRTRLHRVGLTWKCEYRTPPGACGDDNQ